MKLRVPSKWMTLWTKPWSNWRSKASSFDGCADILKGEHGTTKLAGSGGYIPDALSLSHGSLYHHQVRYAPLSDPIQDSHELWLMVLGRDVFSQMTSKCPTCWRKGWWDIQKVLTETATLQGGLHDGVWFGERIWSFSARTRARADVKIGIALIALFLPHVDCGTTFARDSTCVSSVLPHDDPYLSDSLILWGCEVAMRGADNANGAAQQAHLHWSKV